MLSLLTTKVKKIADLLNQVSKQFELPTFDNNYTPHVSIAWYPITGSNCTESSDQDSPERDYGNELLSMVSDLDSQAPFDRLSMPCSCVKIKMGKAASTINLPSRSEALGAP